MSMTREEARKHLHDDWYIENGRLYVDGDKKDAFLEAAGMGITALRPVSREQVEKFKEFFDDLYGKGLEVLSDTASRSEHAEIRHGRVSGRYSQ